MTAEQMIKSFLPLIALFAIMYFLLIRPQKKKEKQVNSMRSSVKVGDEILTIGGIYGKVIKTKEDRLTIEVGSDKTRFEVTRWAISSVVNAAAESKKEAKAEKAKAKEADEIQQMVEEDNSADKKKNYVRKNLKKESD